ncbi:MAG: sugar ABC transporter substrate-binding protein [Ruminococcaceae bacterium]|nr:sugar ABC transporter substrate-binding protein [Oscillospiraceae bacterium]
MKKLISLVLAGILAISLAACGSSQPAPASSSAAPSSVPASSEPASSSQPAPKPAEKDYTVSVVLKTLSSEYWGYVKAGCDKAAQDFGITVNVLGPAAESEISEQVAQIEQQLSANVDAIVVAPCESSAAAGALATAVGKIPVLFVDTDAELEGKTSFVGTGNKEAAALGGKYIADKLGKGGKAVCICGQLGEATSESRLSGYKESLEAGGITVLDTLSGQNTADKSMATMEDLLARFPNEIQAVLCHNDDTAIGAQQACEQNGIDNIKIIGFDGNKSAVDLILAGKLEGTIAQQPFQMGYMAVEAAVKSINGEKIDPVIPVPAKLITKDNAQAYLDELASMSK